MSSPGGIQGTCESVYGTYQFECPTVPFAFEGFKLKALLLMDCMPTTSVY